MPGVERPQGKGENMRLIELLNYGSENAVSLSYLSAMPGMHKRRVRDELSKITESGEECVCTNADGSGYYLASTSEEINRYEAYIQSYIHAGLRKARGIKKFKEKKQNEQQICLFKE